MTNHQPDGRCIRGRSRWVLAGPLVAGPRDRGLRHPPDKRGRSREHRRAKTDRLDTALLKRVFLGWLRGEPGHCTMAAIPTLEEEDARRPNREREGTVNLGRGLAGRAGTGRWPA